MAMPNLRQAVFELRLSKKYSKLLQARKAVQLTNMPTANFTPPPIINSNDSTPAH